MYILNYPRQTNSRIMTDQDIIQGLIARDNTITEQFFYVKCRPLLTTIMRLVFNYHIEYNEMVSELYEYIMANDAAKLRQFQYRSSIYQWMKVVATRFFIRKRNDMIETTSKEPLYEKPEGETVVDLANDVTNRMDVRKLLDLMENRRYANAIIRLVLEDADPDSYAAEIGVTIDNLYNIKKRAMTAFTRIAIKYYSYGG